MPNIDLFVSLEGHMMVPKLEFVDYRNNRSTWNFEWEVPVRGLCVGPEILCMSPCEIAAERMFIVPQLSATAKLDIHHSGSLLSFSGSADLTVRSFHIKGRVHLSFSPGLETVTVSFEPKPQVGYSTVAKLKSKEGYDAWKGEAGKAVGEFVGLFAFGKNLVQGKGDEFCDSDNVSPLLVSCGPQIIFLPRGIAVGW